MKLIDVLLLAYAGSQILAALFNLSVLISITSTIYGSPCNGWPAEFGPCRLKTYSRWNYRTFCPLEGRIGYDSNSEATFYFLSDVNEPCLFPVIGYTLSGFAHLGQAIGIFIIYFKFGRSFKDATSWVLMATACSFLCLILELIPAMTVTSGFKTLCISLGVPMCNGAEYIPSKYNCNPTSKPHPTCEQFGSDSFVGQWRIGIGFMWTASALVILQTAFVAVFMCRRIHNDGRLPKTFIRDSAPPADTFSKKMRESKRKLVARKAAEQPTAEQWQGGGLTSSYLDQFMEPQQEMSAYPTMDSIISEPGSAPTYSKKFQSRYAPGPPEEMYASPSDSSAGFSPTPQQPQHQYQPKHHEQYQVHDELPPQENTFIPVHSYSSTQI